MLHDAMASMGEEEVMEAMLEDVVGAEEEFVVDVVDLVERETATTVINLDTSPGIVQILLTLVEEVEGVEGSVTTASSQDTLPVIALTSSSNCD